MKTKLARLVVVSAILFFSLGAANAATISVDPTGSYDPLGATSVSFEVFFNTGSGEVYAAQSFAFNIDFDASELSYTSSTNELDSSQELLLPGATDPWDLRYVNLAFPGVSFPENTSTLLLTVDFGIIDPSIVQDFASDFLISGVIVNDVAFDVSAQGADVGAPVPIPGAILLLGSGLVGLIGLRRKLS